MEKVKVIVTGACGRMGSTNIRLILEDKELELVGAVERKGHENIGKDIGEIIFGKKIGISVVDDLEKIIEKGDVVIEFTNPEATINNLRIAKKYGKKMVIGTTGLSEEQMKEIEEASKDIAIVYSPNFSVGVNVLFKITELVAKTLKGLGFDAEIVEIHHRKKKDAPSGTAVKLMEIIMKNMGLEKKVFGREGIVGERGDEEIGVFAVRGGDVVGEHYVMFFGTGERIELSHRATTREIFSKGALQAIKFVSKKEKGLYNMFDVLGI